MSSWRGVFRAIQLAQAAGAGAAAAEMPETLVRMPQ